ncbi:histidine kinase [Clostridiaceae bacterium 35-E11]
MILDAILNKIPLIKKESDQVKILFFYRYLSLVGTSFFYVLGDRSHSIANKVIVVSCLSVSSMILTYLYIKTGNQTKRIRFLVLIETLGNCFILIPSGGLSSPYVWYALNTIMIASVKLNKKSYWMNLFIYLIGLTGMAHFIFDKGKVKAMDLIHNESNLILSFILITAAVQLLSVLLEKIQNESEKVIAANQQLLSANKKIKESMQHIMALYQAVHSFTNQRSKNNLIKLLIHYTREITKTNMAFFYDVLEEEGKIIIDGSKGIKENVEELLSTTIVSQWNGIIDSDRPIEINNQDQRLMIVVVRATYKVYGILGIEISADKKDIMDQENIYQLQFLSELSAMVLERFYLEEISEEFVITEEQNRIANEIHDSVLQRLFSMSCGMFTLMRNLESITPDQIREELNLIRNAANNAIKELRSTIYGLSWKKNGVNIFEVDIENYINEIKRFNNVEILFQMIGNPELLLSGYKKAFYRMICEGVGNALRHGKANHIGITLEIHPQLNSLKIVDNGKGFDFKEIKSSKQKGLGIRNMHYLTESLNGTIRVKSEKGKGTMIEITIPNNTQIFKKEEVV